MGFLMTICFVKNTYFDFNFTQIYQYSIFFKSDSYHVVEKNKAIHIRSKIGY